VLVAGPNAPERPPCFTFILGISRPDAGRILLDGRPLFDGRVDVPAERRPGLRSQDSALFPHLDVLGNVAFGLGHLPRAERRDRAGAWLTNVGVSDLGRRRTAALSGGERQARRPGAVRWRGSPARSCWTSRFASLDPTSRRELRISLRRWLAEGRLPALIVSHDPADASVRGSHRSHGAGAYRAAGHGGRAARGAGFRFRGRVRGEPGDLSIDAKKKRPPPLLRAGASDSNPCGVPTSRGPGSCRARAARPNLVGSGLLNARPLPAQRLEADTELETRRPAAAGDSRLSAVPRAIIPEPDAAKAPPLPRSRRVDARPRRRPARGCGSLRAIPGS